MLPSIMVDALYTEYAGPDCEASQCFIDRHEEWFADEE